MPRPYTSARVTFANSDYDSVCLRFGGGPTRLDAWRDLGDVLAGRSSWHFDVDVDDGPLWSMGVFGESRLNIYVTASGGFHCFDHLAGEEVEVSTLAEVEAWLARREQNATVTSAAQREYARTYDWKVLTEIPIAVGVSWSDGAWAASVPDCFDVALAPTLAEAVAGARTMICALFDAPAEIAARLTVTADLDETAVRQLTADMS
jgi:hypothetical protein